MFETITAMSNKLAYSKWLMIQSAMQTSAHTLAISATTGKVKDGSAFAKFANHQLGIARLGKHPIFTFYRS